MMCWGSVTSVMTMLVAPAGIMDMSLYPICRSWSRITPVISHLLTVGLTQCLDSNRFLNANAGEGPTRGLLHECETSNFAKVCLQFYL